MFTQRKKCDITYKLVPVNSKEIGNGDIKNKKNDELTEPLTDTKAKKSTGMPILCPQLQVIVIVGMYE